MGGDHAAVGVAARLPGAVSGRALQLHRKGISRVLRARDGTSDRRLEEGKVMNRIVSMSAAAAASAVMLWFGTGLQPLWWLTWLAPLPLLWVAPRLPAAWSFGLATLAWAAGAANEWSYA